MDQSVFNINNYNNDFLIIKSKNRIALSKLGRSIYDKQFSFITEVIVAETELCIKLNHFFKPSDIHQLYKVESDHNPQSKIYKLPIYFTAHDDWKGILDHCGMDRTAIIDKLVSAEFTIVMFGFLPGFIYMDGLNEALHIPRKKVPAKHVEAQSLAIGGKYLGLYPADSPGGWYVIGKVPINHVDLTGIPPMACNLGDRIQLETIDLTTFDELRKQNISLTTYNKEM